MLNHYRNTHPYAIVLIVITAIILWIPVFIKREVFVGSNNDVAFPLSGVFGFLFTLPNIVLVILGFILFLILAFYLAWINSKTKLSASIIFYFINCLDIGHAGIITLSIWNSFCFIFFRQVLFFL